MPGWYEDQWDARRGAIYSILGRLGSIQHSLYPFLRPLRVGENYPTDPAEWESYVHALRVKAKGLREIADLMDEMADNVEVE
jgi:hypothetical protein